MSGVAAIIPGWTQHPLIDSAIAGPYAVAGFAHDLVLLPVTIIIIVTFLHVDVIIALKVSPPRPCVSKTRFNPFYGIPVT